LYLYIETLKQRLDAINQLRVDRALAAMGPAFQQVYSLLPTLLHYHHPLMPGYLDGNVPKGICLFTPYFSMAVIIALPAFIFARVPDDTSKNVVLRRRKRSES
jgi:adenylate cyclase